MSEPQLGFVLWEAASHLHEIWQNDKKTKKQTFHLMENRTIKLNFEAFSTNIKHFKCWSDLAHLFSCTHFSHLRSSHSNISALPIIHYTQCVLHIIHIIHIVHNVYYIHYYTHFPHLCSSNSKSALPIIHYTHDKCHISKGLTS